MKYFYTMIICLVAISSQAQYTVKSNLITLSTSENTEQVMRNIKGLLIGELYGIKTFDTDFNLIETDYKKLKNISTRLHIMVKDSLIEFRGYSTNGLSTSAYSGGIGLSSAPSELRNEFRNSKITVMMQGFIEMERIARLYQEKYSGVMDVVKE